MNDFLIALVGDGYFNRWGDGCPELQDELVRLYNHSEFRIANHALDGTRMGSALARITTDYMKHGLPVEHVAMCNPNVVLVESCAYSQFWDGPEGLTEYRDLLRRTYDEIDRTTSSKVLFCLAPAPLRDRFLENVPEFANASKATRGRFADTVKMYLEEARSIAEDEGWFCADIGEEIEKLVAEGQSPRRFINNNDNIYPSQRGYEIAAKIIVRAIDNHRYINETITK